jgi:hypothetical protein
MITPDPDPVPAPDDELSVTERKLLSAAVRGALVDLRTGDARLDDPAKGTGWGADRQIRAELLTELLTGTRYTNGKFPRAIKLRGARITGLLDLEASTLTCPLLLRECHIDKPVDLGEATAPVIRMPGCHLTTLAARQLRTTGDLTLNAKFTATGEVLLHGAHIGGQLDMNGAILDNPAGKALAADSLTVDQSMHCSEGFTATGEVRLLGAHIGGQLDMNGAILDNPAGKALAADSLTVDQSMHCEGFTATGEVCLHSAHIGGQLAFVRASLTNSAGKALAADSLTVNQNMHCEGFTATGEVRLLGAHIGGQLIMDGAILDNPAGKALTADRLTVNQNMHCEGFTATGEVCLHSAHIGGQLVFVRASLTNPAGRALNLAAATVSSLFLLPQQPDGAVDLTNANAGTFDDDPAGWPATLYLRGFAYDSLENDDVSARGRLRWLARHPGGYTPQLYDQLANTYRRAGDEQAARTIAIAKQLHRRSAFSPLSWLWYITVGYGYRTWLAGVWLAALAALGSLVFGRAYPAHMIAVSSHPQAFQPVIYTLDLLLPVIDLGQRTAWQPTNETLLIWYWALIAAGWVLTTAVVAGLTGILKRD